jgi:cytochrome c biogenesis protein CcmG/thiol:disulfide interchange protein DsbE
LVAVRRRAIPILVSVAGACLLALLIYGISTQAASRTLDEQVAKGAQPPAPHATQPLPILGAPGTGSLAAMRGKVVVLNFWASWCEPCQVEAPLLESAQKQLTRHDGTVLGVTYKDVTGDSERFVREYHLSYVNLRDAGGTFAAAYGTDQLPESFIIDREGRIVAISRGEISKPFLDRAVALAAST